MKWQRKISFGVFWLALSALYAVFVVGAEFSGWHAQSAAGWRVLAMQWACVSGCAAALLGLVAVNRRIFAAAFPVLALVTGVALYFEACYGARITPTAIELAAVNGLSTWRDVVSWPLAVALGAVVAASWLAVKLRFRTTAPRWPWLWALAFAAVVAAPFTAVPRLHAPVSNRLPYAPFCSAWQYLDLRREPAIHRPAFDKTPAATAADTLTVVVVLGESLRADHLPFNGYHRNTAPRLSGIQGLVSYPNIYSEAFHTHASVPHIMTRADSANTDIGFTEPSFITLFRRAGFRTSWLSNQDTDLAYTYFMHEADTLDIVARGQSLYGNRLWLDTDLLPALDSMLTSKAPLQLAVLHSIGSHWWYPSHYTRVQAVFRPEADSRVLSELTQQQMINSYDNTIIATDAFLASVIQRLQHRRAVLLYISDHGEALGEDGHYLHAEPWAPTHRPAMLVWASESYRRTWPEVWAALQANAQRHASTDVVFHTVLDAAAISTPVLKPQLSLARHP